MWYFLYFIVGANFQVSPSSIQRRKITERDGGFGKEKHFEH
jgi:hypothetical protein